MKKAKSALKRKQIIDASNYTCDVCNYRPKQTSKYAVKIHKEAVHLGVRYQCPQCGHPCSTKSNMKKCGLTCSNKVNKKTHVKKAQSKLKRKQIIDASNYTCDVCNYRPKQFFY